MIRRHMMYPWACIATLCIATASTAYADDIDRVRQLRSTDSILPLSQILTTVERRYPGTLLDVELEDESADPLEHESNDGSHKEQKRIIYEIEVLGSDHIIREIKVDARSGQIIASEQD